MIINIKQGTRDTKEDYLNLLDELEGQGFRVFNISCYDLGRKLSEATMIKDDKKFIEGISLSGNDNCFQ
ncbi:hypothetical protein [Acetivibrio cellulolyticus]|uniref:hypothetical protein n=1 Tax=Acetivibrio cellulolyticus TaxID=35830 RepID=UPI0001E2EBC5|nr:hypothetical protein [Acetivibrio cellulolyticus]